MTLHTQSEQMLPKLEEELQRQVRRLDRPDSRAFHDMLDYHMGWAGERVGSKATGKRVRPLLMLLVVASCRGQWLHALAPAAAIELLHNFSLVHDDIEDNSPTRRGRTTVWKKFGMPMAINVGDALFVISDLAIMDTAERYSAELAVRAARCLHEACLALTRGQYLDMSFEKRSDVDVDDYWRMIDGKTAALLAASGEIGALLGGADNTTIQHYVSFGRNLGLAFQVQDDILGIWGDEGATGKSAASDLVEGKNSLPILYGMRRNAGFARRWAAGPVAPGETMEVAQLLRDEGAHEYCAREAERLTSLAMHALESAAPQGEAGAALVELAQQLLGRRA